MFWWILCKVHLLTEVSCCDQVYAGLCFPWEKCAHWCLEKFPIEALRSWSFLCEKSFNYNSSLFNRCRLLVLSIFKTIVFWKIVFLKEFSHFIYMLQYIVKLLYIYSHYLLTLTTSLYWCFYAFPLFCFHWSL